MGMGDVLRREFGKEKTCSNKKKRSWKELNNLRLERSLVGNRTFPFLQF